MYHPGKVLRVFAPDDADIVSSDKDTHVLVSMWDENLMTLLVHSKLSGSIGVDDVVLVDYRPISSTLPVPKFIVTKVLSGEHAAETWKTYKEKYRVLKAKPIPIMGSQGGSIQPQHSYIG